MSFLGLDVGIVLADKIDEERNKLFECFSSNKGSDG